MSVFILFYIPLLIGLWFLVDAVFKKLLKAKYKKL